MLLAIVLVIVIAIVLLVAIAICKVASLSEQYDEMMWEQNFLTDEDSGDTAACGEARDRGNAE